MAMTDQANRLREDLFEDDLAKVDPEIFGAIEQELGRQRDDIELIASENIVSKAVLEAQGSVLTNKYAEGYPGRRYYGGCEEVDVAESLAIARAKALFGADHANVQPHSGAQANMSVFLATLKPGDTVLGMNLAHGGHLTHGHPLNFSGKLYTIVPYGVRAEDERIDYDEVARLCHEHKPKLVVIGASAYPRTIDFARIAAAAKAVGALVMTDMAHIAGLVATGQHPSPVPHSDFVTTTTHKTLRGPRGGLILANAEHEKALNSSIFPSIQGGPLMHVIAAKAVALLEAQQPSFVDYQRSVLANARVMAETLTARGLRIVSGRTESHVFLVDLRPKKVTGKDAEAALGKAHITVNKNAIPNDPEKPFVTSGIRIGSPAMTTRGFGEAEAKAVGNLIADVFDAQGEAAKIAQIGEAVKSLCAKFPVYGPRMHASFGIAA